MKRKSSRIRGCLNPGVDNLDGTAWYDGTAGKACIFAGFDSFAPLIQSLHLQGLFLSEINHWRCRMKVARDWKY
jgi:hypothetical protein